MKDENWDSFNGVFTLRQKSMCAFFICFLSSDSLIFFIQCYTYQIVMNIPGINSSSQTGSYGIMIPISTFIGFWNDLKKRHDNGDFSCQTLKT